MKLDFLVSGANQVVDDVGGRGVTTRAAKPLAAPKAFHDGAWVVDSAIAFTP